MDCDKEELWAAEAEPGLAGLATATVAVVAGNAMRSRDR
jgi:hypothetical protein